LRFAYGRSGAGIDVLDAHPGAIQRPQTGAFEDSGLFSGGIQASTPSADRSSRDLCERGRIRLKMRWAGGISINREPHGIFGPADSARISLATGCR
jgi:hypothetical protein